MKHPFTPISLFVLTVLFPTLLAQSVWAGKIIRPWRATTAIVEQGSTFEIWYAADSGQNVSRIDLRSQHKRINGLSFTTQNGDWEYDFHSGNRYNRLFTVTVPNSVPADRYELLLQTSTGEENSEGAVKVIKQYRNEYYIMGVSCVHRFQSSSSADVDGDGGVDDDDHILQLRKISEILKIADIMDVQMYFEAGDNVYSPDANAPYYGSSRDQNWVTFNGISELGIMGLHQTSAAVYMTAGNHEAPDNTVNGEAADLLAEYFNEKWGMYYHGEVYGNARYLNVNNGWGGGSYDPTGQMNVLKNWMDAPGGPGRGNFIVAIMHKNREASTGPYQSVPFDLSLSGHSHTAASSNPYSIPYSGGNSPAMQYVADSNRSTSRFEFTLFKINNSNGSYSKPSGVTARTDAVEGSFTNPNNWTRKLELNYANSNNGSRTSNSATITSRYNFGIDEAKIRFVMAGGAVYSVDNGATIRQQFTADNGNVIVDVAVDVSSNSNKTVNITPGGDPIVNFTTPSGSTVVGQGTDLNVEVSAVDSDGTVSNVRLYKDNVLVRQEGGSPWTWGVAQGDSVLGNLPIGSFDLRAVATDNEGNTGESTITVTVADSSTQVSFVKPSESDVIWEGESLEFEVNATDIDGVNRVYLYKNGVELTRSEGLAPYTWGESGQGDVELQSLPAGDYVFRAVAEDDLGNTGEATINITVRDLGDVPPIYINFQPSGSAVPSGYIADSSQPFADRGNGYSYGWDSSFNQTRDRNSHADQRLDTLNHTQANGGDHFWEIELFNGEYTVSVTAGDPTATNSFYEFVAEEGTANAVTLMSAAGSAGNFASGTQNVLVSDGRLTISNGPNASNNKICYIDIVRVQASNSAPVITSSAVTTVNEGDAYSYTVVATDADGDTLSYNGITVPSWLTFSSSGQLTGTPQTANVGPHSVSLEVSDGEDTDVQNFTITVVSAFNAWKTTHSVTEDLGDDDNDGISNLMEFALGGDPRSEASGQHPVVSKNGNDFEFSFRREQASVTYLVEKSTDLINWTTHSTDPGTVGGDVVVPVNNSEMNGGKLFLRLRVND